MVKVQCTRERRCIAFNWNAFQALSMTSAKTQLPYEYYSLSFCGLENPEEFHYKKLNLGSQEGVPSSHTLFPEYVSKTQTLFSLSLAGEVLRGDRIVNTLYKVSCTFKSI